MVNSSPTPHQGGPRKPSLLSDKNSSTIFGFGHGLGLPSLAASRVGSSTFDELASPATDTPLTVYGNTPTGSAFDDDEAYQTLLAKLDGNNARSRRTQSMITDNGSFEVAGGGVRLVSNGSSNVPNAAALEKKAEHVKQHEFEALQRQLNDTKEKLARKEEELNQTRIAKLTLERGLGPAEIADPEIDVNDNTIANLQNVLNAATRPFASHVNSSTASNSLSASGYSTGSFSGQNIWGNTRAENIASTIGYNWNHSTRNLFNGIPNNSANNQVQPLSEHNSSVEVFTTQLPLSRVTAQPYQAPPVAMDRLGLGHRYNPAALTAHGRLNATNRGFGLGIMTTDRSPLLPGMTPPETPATPSLATFQQNGTTHLTVPGACMSRTRLSPTAAEFNYSAPTPWNTPTGFGQLSQAGQIANAPVVLANTNSHVSYVALNGNSNSGFGGFNGNTSAVPANNWKLLVEKIVHGADQQSSILMQQKIKVVDTPEKYRMCEAILGHCYTLMINRFGNFLVQRVLEHGTPDQIMAVANTIRGHVVALSMDPFGCHVVQKALDIVPEEYKAAMVHELLRRIPDTVIHRYACHVWQKLFELRWSDSPPQIMRYVNDALRGMWHEVALGETGSLVVQNIFENCLEEDKRPCIDEVLAGMDIVARGQYGNWCIQHICEHGAPADRERAIDHIVCCAVDYSLDQYASKVIEKCLKIGGAEFYDRYLERVCEARPDRPRIPLIDIAADQYGNYLVQYINGHGPPEARAIVATHVRKHMVSLRGSKYGSRVALGCQNNKTQIHPGPPSGPAPLPNPAHYNHFPGKQNSHHGQPKFNGAHNFR